MDKIQLFIDILHDERQKWNSVTYFTYVIELLSVVIEIWSLLTYAGSCSHPQWNIQTLPILVSVMAFP